MLIKGENETRKNFNKMKSWESEEGLQCAQNLLIKYNFNLNQEMCSKIQDNCMIGRINEMNRSRRQSSKKSCDLDTYGGNVKMKTGNLCCRWVTRRVTRSQKEAVMLCVGNETEFGAKFCRES